MHIDTPASDISGATSNIRLGSSPDECPRCHRAVHPKFVSAHLLNQGLQCQAVFRCTHHSCSQVFFGNYYQVNTGTRSLYSLASAGPVSPRGSVFPEAVREVSPAFCEIYGQAEQAEAQDLEQLVGIGLRKALEFLVKDFAVSEHPEKTAAIQSSTLASCIGQYVSDPNVKECAKRAAWLGNDETHYVRKWEEKDVKDLKVLVRLTANWIENTRLTKKYIDEMQAGA